MKKNILLIGFAVFSLAGMLFAAFPTDSQAVPPFARKYKTACTTCHWGTFPKLNAFGNAFKANGLRMPGGGDEVFVKDEPVAMGASAWSKLFPKAVWPGDVPGMPPIGVLTKFGMTATRERPQGVRGGDDDGSPLRAQDLQFNGFEDLEVLVGMTFGETMSFFAAGKWNDLERAYLNYTPFIKGEQGLVNVRVGRIDTRVNPVSNHLKQIRNRNYLMNEMPTIATGNFFGFHPNQLGIELWGSMNGPGGKGGLEYAVGIVNGHWGEGSENLIGTGDVDTIKTNMTTAGAGIGNEINNGKDYYAMVSYKLWGMGVLGEESVDDSLVAKENWQDNSVRIKGYWYHGTTGAYVDNATSAATGDFGNPLIGGGHFDDSANEFDRYGVVLEANWWNLAFMAAAAFMEDDISGTITYAASGGLPQESGSSFDTNIYTAEVNWVALPWLIPSMRVENVNPDYDARDIESFTRYTFETRLITRANTTVNIGGSFSNYMDSESIGGVDVPSYDLNQASDDACWIQTEVAF
ncbi:MAG: hypothetical protein R2568_05885 [Candidatus Scalindua sp.]|jgi:hypothetical protein|nr:hypothetical protein [Candidatus Scalindua sp.]MDV5166262.1 hypothetical protein [Candidatus Scalindua sp.]